MSFDHSDEYEFTGSNISFKPFAAIKHNGFTIPANSKIKVTPIFHCSIFRHNRSTVTLALKLILATLEIGNILLPPYGKATSTVKLYAFRYAMYKSCRRNECQINGIIIGI